MSLNCSAWEDSQKSLRQQGDQISQSCGNSTLNTHWKDWCWSSSILIICWEEGIIGKVPDAGKDWGQKEKRVSDDEMAGWHHWCNGHELGQNSGDGKGQRGLVCCSPWGFKELDMTLTTTNSYGHVILKWVEYKNWKYKQMTRYTQLIDTNKISCLHTSEICFLVNITFSNLSKYNHTEKENV